MGKPGLTSAGSAPRGPCRLRARATNGPAPRARRPRRRLEAPQGRGGTPEGTQPSAARRLSLPLTHSPRAAGRRPFPSLATPLPSPAPAPHTHRLNIYLRRAARAQPNLLPGPAPTCPASEPPSRGGRERERGRRGNRHTNQSQPEMRFCARSDWAALRQTFLQWRSARSRLKGLSAPSSSVEPKGKRRGGEEERGRWAGTSG